MRVQGKSQKHRIFSVILAISGFICIGLIYNALNNSPKTVDFSSGIEHFKKTGTPGFSLPSFENGAPSNIISFNETSSKIIIVNFWASWCAPCVDEFSSLLNLAKRFSNKGDIEILAVSIDQDFNSLQEFLTKNEKDRLSNFKILLDLQGKVAEKYGTKKIPETYVIDKHHRLIMKVVDKQDWMSGDFQAFVENTIR